MRFSLALNASGVISVMVPFSSFTSILTRWSKFLYQSPTTSNIPFSVVNICPFIGFIHSCFFIFCIVPSVPKCSCSNVFPGSKCYIVCLLLYLYFIYILEQIGTSQYWRGFQVFQNVFQNVFQQKPFKMEHR